MCMLKPIVESHWIPKPSPIVEREEEIHIQKIKDKIFVLPQQNVKIRSMYILIICIFFDSNLLFVY